MSVLAAISIATAVVTASVPIPASAQRTPPRVIALAPSVAGPVDDGTAQTVAVLGFDEGGKAGRNLAIALSKTLQSRGHDVRVDAAFAEVRLALGCADYETRCLARAPENLGVDAVVFGTLRQSGDDVAVELFLVEAGAQDVSAHVSVASPIDKLSGAGAYGEGRRFADILWPRESQEGGGAFAARPSPPPTSSVSAPVLRDTEATEQPPRRSGPYKMPVWTKAGLGASAGLFGLGIIGAVVSTVLIRNYQSDVVTLVASSPNDENDANDIPTNAPDYCEAAEAPPPDGAGTVTNAAVAEACKNGRNAQRVNYASWAFTGIGAVGLIGVVAAHFVLRSRHNRGLARISPTASGVRVRF